MAWSLRNCGVGCHVAVSVGARLCGFTLCPLEWCLRDPLQHPQTEADGMEDSRLPLAALLPGSRLGAYKLIRLLGTGGMGQVWLAQQQQPLQRTVALKLQRDRLSGGTDEAYFQIERQALAQLLHPYVAQIYDAGSMADGSLYFAMEFVDGLRLDEWLQRRKPSLRQLIELLIKLCQGVQHAHQRGLLHRDLKPANVLVVEVGGQALPKIIDFGVAIGLDPRSGVAMGTRRAGTRAWMAPEQLRPDAGGIDARVDVYALGLLLALAMCRVLGLEEPDVGSQQMQTLFARSTDLEQRTAPQSEVGRATVAMDMAARRNIPAELRAIAGRAIAQDREARYDSASAMADDLQRWCDRLPVKAMKGGRWYAARCFVRRNALATAAAALVLLALLVGLGAAAFGLAEARRAQALAEARQQSAERLIGYMLGDFADKLRPLAKLDLLDGVSSEAMHYLQTHPVEDAADIDPQAVLNRARALRTVGEVLSGRGQAQEARSAFDEAARTLELVADGAPPEIWKERGTVAYWQGYLDYRNEDFAAAKVHWERYLGNASAYGTAGGDPVDADLEVSYALDNLGTLAFEQNQFDQTRDRLQRSVELKRSVLQRRGDDLDATSGLANALSWLARAYEALGDLQSAADNAAAQVELIGLVRQRDPDAPRWQQSQASAFYWRAQMLLAQGQIDAAQELLLRSSELYRQLVKHDPQVQRWPLLLAMVLTQSSVAYQHRGDYEMAARLLTDANATVQAIPDGAVQHSERQRVLATIELRRALIALQRNRDAELQQAVQRGVVLLETELNQPEPHRLTVVLYASLVALGSEQEPLQRAQRMLEPWLKVRQDHALLEAAARALVAQGQVGEGAVLISQLQRLGYRHPDFLAFTQTEGTQP